MKHLLGFIVILLTFMGCEKESDLKESDLNETEAKLIGSWKYTGGDVDLWWIFMDNKNFRQIADWKQSENNIKQIIEGTFEAIDEIEINYIVKYDSTNEGESGRENIDVKYLYEILKLTENILEIKIIDGEIQTDFIRESH